jgi:predicted butyrate kinase (DUF1464 family)
MVRVAGTDPGSSSLDVVILQDGVVVDQARFLPEQLRGGATAPLQWLQERGPYDLIAGPSGYGLPLVRAAACTDLDLERMTLVRPDERGRADGVTGFGTLLRGLRASGLPVVFLPGVVHLASVPEHRKLERIDLGTADKLCVAALALAQALRTRAKLTFGVVELGSVFSAGLVVAEGRIVDGVGGTAGPAGWGSMGCWDGEVAYLCSPLAKGDLFAGGCAAGEAGLLRFRESILKTIAGLRAVTPFERVYLSGRLLETHPEVVSRVVTDLATLAQIEVLTSLPGAWVKHAAQGAALLADGLAGGASAALVERLQLRDAHGSVVDWLRHPKTADARCWFGTPT